MIGVIPKILLQNMDKWKYENDKMVAIGTVSKEIQDAIDSQNTKQLGEEVDTLKSLDNKDDDNLFHIAKTDDDKRLVFGWALVAENVDGQVIQDHQGDIVDPEDLEEGAYQYVLDFRDGGEEHIPSLRKKARMVESCVFTKEKQEAIGIPAGTIPVGWWIGFYVDDDEAWQKIKDGTYKMFSIEGRGIRIPIDEVKTTDSLTKSDNVAKSFAEILKFNPYHDRLGRFTSASGANSFSASRWQMTGYDDKKTAFEQRGTGAAGGSEPKAMTEQEYLDSKGVGSITSDYGIDKLKLKTSQFTTSQQNQRDKQALQAIDDYHKQREAAKQEYKDKIKSGELRNKSKVERLITTAQGHDDNPSVQAARRLLANKHGIDWKTGESLNKSDNVAKSFAEILKFNPFHDRLGRFTSGGGFMASGYTGDKNRQAVTFSANPNTKAGAMAIERARGNHP